MAKFPVDAPLDRVLAAMALLGFHVVRSGNHVALARQNDDGTQTPMTIPNHRRLKRSTLRTILTQSDEAGTRKGVRTLLKKSPDPFSGFYW